MKNKQIFISYRRDDAAATAGRIKDRLHKFFPNLNIFMDVDTIAGGEDFSERIFSSIRESDIFICIIGDKWAINDDNENRLLNADDYVKQEIATALESECTVYPILLNDCKMPTIDILPKEIHKLCSLNALELRNSRFNDDFNHIIENVFKVKREHLERKPLSKLIRAISFGLPTGYFALFLIAQLNFWITNKSLALTLGENLTTLSIILTPIIASYLFYKKR